MFRKVLMRAVFMFASSAILFSAIGQAQEAGKPGAPSVGPPVIPSVMPAAFQEKDQKKDEKAVRRPASGHKPLHHHASFLDLPISRQIHHDRVVDRQFVVPRPGVAIIEAPATGFSIPLNAPRQQEVFQTFFPDKPDLLLNVTANTRVDVVYVSKDANRLEFHPFGIPVKGDAAFGTTGRTLVFVQFAKDAVAGKKQFLLTHTEIFPGTFASTTETADYLLTRLELKRKAVLRWGPMGTQVLCEVKQGGFHLLGFAGNSAPDHVDVLHALPELLADWGWRKRD